MKTKLLTLALMLIGFSSFALTGSTIVNELDPASPVDLVVILTPIIVFGVGELVKLISPLIPGWAMVVVVVPALSGAVTWASTLLTDQGSWLVQFGFGLLSVFIHQLSKQLQAK